MSVPDGIFELSATAKRAFALPGTKPQQGMPWLRGEATGLPGLRTANRQRDHRSRLESSSFRAMEDVKLMSFIRCGGAAGLAGRARFVANALADCPGPGNPR